VPKTEKTKRNAGRPPLVIGGTRVLEYASIRPPVVFSGRTNHFVNGVELGAVPRLVISQSLRGNEIQLNYCDESWDVLGCLSVASVTEAKQRAERNYPGVSRAWRKYRTSRRRALAYERKQWKGHVCSFCGRIPPEFNSWVLNGKATILRPVRPNVPC
jgi:hypothetical protein